MTVFAYVTAASQAAGFKANEWVSTSLSAVGGKGDDDYTIPYHTIHTTHWQLAVRMISTVTKATVLLLLCCPLLYP